MSDQFTVHFFKHLIGKLANNLSDEYKFTSISERALDILADAAIYRLQTYAREIRQLIEYSGRTEPNGFDVFNILWRYNETIESISRYTSDQGLSYEIPVKEYPIQQQSRYHSRFMQGTDILPFRANTNIEYDLSSNGPPLPHIPIFFQPQFGENGASIDDELDNGANSNLIRRQADIDVITSAMKDQIKESVPEDSIPIKMDCEFINQLVAMVIGDSPVGETESVH